jgi:hypothetical protein
MSGGAHVHASSGAAEDPPQVQTPFGGPPSIEIGDNVRWTIHGDQEDCARWLRRMAHNLRVAAEEVAAHAEQSQRDLDAAHAEIARLRGETP